MAAPGLSPGVPQDADLPPEPEQPPAGSGVGLAGDYAGFAGDWLSAPPVDNPEVLTWWAASLLSAIAAADSTPEGEPVLAAAGHAATAALLLLQHRAIDDGDAERTRAHLLEVHGVISDQLLLVREMLQDVSPTPPRRAARASARRPRRRARFSFPVTVPRRRHP
jgi:hypothetical protein